MIRMCIAWKNQMGSRQLPPIATATVAPSCGTVAYIKAGLNNGRQLVFAYMKNVQLRRVIPLLAVLSENMYVIYDKFLMF